MTMATLFTADREKHIDEIKFWLNAEITVICDRYLMSTLVYNTETTHDVEVVVANHCPWYLVPDVVFWLDMTEEHLSKRLEHTASSRSSLSIYEHKERLIFHLWKYRKLFEDATLADLHPTVVRLDGNLPENMLAEQVFTYVKEHENGN